MKRKILAMTIVVFVLFVFCSQAGSEEEFKRKNTKYLVEYEPNPISTEGKEHVDEFLHEFKTALHNLNKQMTDENIKIMASYFGTRGSLTSHDKKIHMGQRAVQDYLLSLPKLADKVTFNIKYVYVKEFIRSRNKKDLWHVVGVIISYSLEINGVPIDPPGGIWGGHVEGCTWNY